MSQALPLRLSLLCHSLCSFSTCCEAVACTCLILYNSTCALLWLSAVCRAHLVLSSIVHVFKLVAAGLVQVVILLGWPQLPGLPLCWSSAITQLQQTQWSSADAMCSSWAHVSQCVDTWVLQVPRITGYQRERLWDLSFHMQLQQQQSLQTCR